MSWGNGKFTPIRSQAESRARANKYHTCLACRKSEPEKWATCPSCGSKDRQYFMSRTELQQGMQRLIQQDLGKIKKLRFQPRFDLMVNGQKVGVYVADCDYYEPDADGKDVYIVEDSKPAEQMESTAKLKIKLMQAIYGIVVRIPQRKSGNISKAPKPTTQKGLSL